MTREELYVFHGLLSKSPNRTKPVPSPQTTNKNATDHSL
jgi:hypothetical protein